MLNSSLNFYIKSICLDIKAYLTVTSNGLFLFESFEERGVQKSVFQDYFKANHIAETGDNTNLKFNFDKNFDLKKIVYCSKIN